VKNLLLAVDVGNTEVKLGVFREGALAASWRVASRSEATEEEWALVLDGFFRLGGLEISDLQAVVLSSTVPPLTPVIERSARQYLGHSPLTIRPGVKTGMPILYDSPQDVGPDRIVNGVAAVDAYGAPVVVVDFGTATTFDAVSPAGEYLGGVIAPGLGISADALFQHAARLPRVEVADPGTAIGRNTIASIQSGLFNGYVALVDGVLEKIFEEYARDYPEASRPDVVCTGGHATLIGPACRRIRHTDPDLTLQGLRILWERNR